MAERESDAGATMMRVLHEAAPKAPDDHASLWREILRLAAPGAAATASSVTLSNPDLVRAAFLDAAGDYSVCGYAARAAKSFGSIYLCLDAGPEYEAQSAKANAAIGAVSAPDAFGVALAATRAILAERAYDVAGVQDLSDAMLAAIASYWFDVPDGAFVLAGGWRLLDVFPPVRCPGDFAAPSGYIFIPEPPFLVAAIGQWLGGMLHAHVAEFVAAHRAPGVAPKGSIARALFEALPAHEDDDLLTRTLIGVMMGMLPTIDGNFTAVLRAWAADGSIARLQAALRASGEADAYARAAAVLETPLKQAMQAAPTPSAVWRTATRDHTIGGACPVHVKAGDKVTFAIAEATRADLAAGVTDVTAIFGGDRSTTPHATHACPGYAMAMGVLLGAINAVLEPTPGATV